MSPYIRSVLFIGLLLIQSHGITLAGDWPSWRGPQNDGASTELNLPIRWRVPENVRWKTEVPGTGTSCPIAVGSSVLLTSTSGRDHSELHVISFDIKEGLIQWDRKFFGTAQPAIETFPPEHGHAMPSLVSDGSIVIALFSTGELFALDIQGHLQWTRSLAADYGGFENGDGIVGSPVISGDRVLVQVDRAQNAFLLAMSLSEGETLWKQDREGISDNWSTPIVTNIGKTQVILCAGSKRLDAFDATNGVLLWTVKGLSRSCCATPTLFDDSVIITSGPAGSVNRFRLPKRLDNKPDELWHSTKTGGFVPSAICVEDLYFYCNDRGVLSCLDLKTGDELWQHRLGGTFLSSPVAADGRIYFTAIDGKVTVINAGRRYEELATNQLGEQISASPAIADGALLYRGEKHLICVNRNSSPVAFHPRHFTPADRVLSLSTEERRRTTLNEFDHARIQPVIR
jgi:outer membrane protein assembly factor BamB